MKDNPVEQLFWQAMKEYGRMIDGPQIRMAMWFFAAGMKQGIETSQKMRKEELEKVA